MPIDLEILTTPDASHPLVIAELRITANEHSGPSMHMQQVEGRWKREGLPAPAFFTHDMLPCRVDIIASITVDGAPVEMRDLSPRDSKQRLYVFSTAACLDQHFGPGRQNRE